jgi:hypothetical protein
MKLIIYSTLFVLCVFSFYTISAQTASRLVAQVNQSVKSSTSSAQIDSQVFAYSAGRGGDLTNNHFWGIAIGRMFDSMKNYVSVSGGTFTKTGLILQDFKGKNTTNVVVLNPNSSGGFDNYMSASLLYDIHNNLVKYNDYTFSSSTWVNNSESVNTFDAANNMITSIWQTWNGSAWVNNNKDSMAYDASGNIILTIYFSWDSTKNQWQAREYDANTYNAANQMTSHLVQNVDISGAAKNLNKDLYQYDLHGHMQSETFQNWNNSSASWITFLGDTVKYNTTGDTSTAIGTTYPTPSTPPIYSRHIVVTDAGGNTVYGLFQSYDNVKGYTDISRNLYTYNSFGQMLSNTSEIANGTGGWIPDTSSFYQSRFYYETYTPTSVASINVSPEVLKVYPNPASDLVNISLKWSEPQTFTVGIYNMQGRLMQQWGMQKTSDYEKQISVSVLPAGNYILSIKGEQGSVQRQMSVIH